MPKLGDSTERSSRDQELKRDTRLPVLAIKVDSDKVGRAYAVTPAIETGRVFLREGAPWLADYLDSIAGFPNAARDDEVDSTTQALNYMIGRSGGTGILDYYAALARIPAAEPETARLRVPQGMGAPTLEDGKMVAVDDAGIITVPADHANPYGQKTQTVLLEEHAKTPYFWLAWVNVALFSIGAPSGWHHRKP